MHDREDTKFTAYVTLPVNFDSEGGNFKFYNKTIDYPTNNEIEIIFFDKEMLYEVTTVEKGCRIVLLFEVICEHEFEKCDEFD